jgi:vanillate O-demethylase ferredoxin subunit
MIGKTVTMPPAPDGANFEIYLAWSDRTLKVEAGQSALQVLLEAGVAISPGCLTGGCGECATAYIEGDIIHKDSCLNIADRQRLFCPCVSRARTRIVIAE